MNTPQDLLNHSSYLCDQAHVETSGEQRIVLEAFATYLRMAYAAANAVYAAAKSATLRQCADIVRRHYPQPPAIGGDHA